MLGITKGVISLPGYDFVTFAPNCPALPSEFPITGWRSKHFGAALSQYHFDSDGLLHMRQLGSEFDFVSDNACGAFPLFRPGISDALYREWWATFHNGRLYAINLAPASSSVSGFHFIPTWEIAGARVDGITQAYLDNDYDASVELIREAHNDPSIKGGSRTSELMLALALCAPARLAGTTPETAWRSLSQSQLQAAQSWFIGLADKANDRRQQ